MNLFYAGKKRLCALAVVLSLLICLVAPAAADSYTYTSPYTEKTYTLASDPEDLVLGIDVSYYQGTIDWEAVAEDGVEFAFIRAAVRYSSTGKLQVDSKFYDNIEGALANGIQVGVYIFSQAITVEEAIEEADYLVELVEGYEIDLPLVFDPEFVTSSTSGKNYGRLYEAYTALEDDEEQVNFMTELANAFITEVEECGYVGMYYGSYSWLNNQVDTSTFSTPVWLARYNTYAGYTGDYVFWQYSSSGSVDGIDGNVDCDFCFDTAYLDCQTLAGTVDPDKTSSITITPTSYPTGTMEASSFSLAGTITSSYPLASVTGTITAADGTVVQTYTATPYSTSFSISGSRVDNNLKFGTLEAGEYTLTYTATDTEGYTVSWTSDPFTVTASVEEDEEAEEEDSGTSGEDTDTEEDADEENSEEEDSGASGEDTDPEEDTEEENPEEEDTEDPSDSSITISATSYPTGSFTASSYTLKGTVTSTKELQSVTGSICKADGTVVQTAIQDGIGSTTFSIQNSKVDNGLKFKSLTPGSYYISYTATDVAGYSTTWTSSIFTVVYTDVTSSSLWYYEAVYSMTDEGIFTGIEDSDGTYYFDPDREISRIEVVVILYRMAGSPSVSGSHPFEDSTADWYQDALIWAYSNDIAEGTSSTTFDPSSSITRESFAALLYRFEDGTALETDYLDSYTDADEVSSWATEAVNWCVANGIINSTSTTVQTLAPGDTATRATAAQLLYNLRENF